MEMENSWKKTQKQWNRKQIKSENEFLNVFPSKKQTKKNRNK